MPRASPKSATTFAFTDKLIEKILPPGHASVPALAIEYTDERTPGLKLSVSKSGRKHWFLRLRVQGIKACFPLGEYPGVGIATAREEAWRLRTMVDRGQDPRAEKARAKAEATTFSDFAAQTYIPFAKSTKRPGTWKGDIQKLNLVLLPAWGNLLLREITTGHVQAVVQELQKKKVSNSTVNTYRALVHHMFQHAMHLGLCEVNPASRIKRLKPAPPRDRFLNDEEVAGFLDRLDGCDADSAAILKLLMLTGARSGEIFRLAWKHIDWENCQALLPLTKTGARRIPLNSLAVQVLREQQARTGGSQWVFPGGKGGPRASVRGTFKRVCRELGIVKCRPHDLRHCCASLLLRSGCTLYEVQKILGHSSPQMTQRYGHLADDTLAKASARLADHITGLAKPKKEKQ